MVKFGERMATEVVPEWANAYVSYARITDFVYAFAKKHPSPTIAQRQQFERDMLVKIEEELVRANELFVRVFDDLEERCHVLRTQPVTATPSESGYSTMDSTTLRFASSAPLFKSDRRSLGSEKRRGSKRHVKFASTDDVDSPGAAGESTLLPDLASPGLAMAASAIIMSSAPVTRSSFQDWFHEAENLQRFADLANEAIRKAAKKAEKNIEGVRVQHLALDAFERRELATREGELKTMIELVKLEYEHRFHQSLQQFEDTQIVTQPQWRPKYAMVAVAVALFLVTLWLPLEGVMKREAHNCLALFALAVTLWITEAFPYFATALLIPLVAVPLQVLRNPADPSQPADAATASHMLLGKMFETVQILVMGGLTMAKALDKSQLAGVAEGFLHKRTARQPHLYMLGVMATGCALCVFVSNVAAPVLVLGVVRRTLLRMPRGDNRAAPQRAMLLGLAFACNLGGMLSPIASPQNAVALHVLNLQNVSISFGKWIMVTLPFVVILLLASWLLLLKLLKPFDHMTFVPLPDKASGKGTLTHAQRMMVLVVCGTTAALWCMDTSKTVGGPAMVALIPIVFFFGFGILEKDDFNTLSWHLIFLLSGGSMLGLCAQSSGLLTVVSSSAIHLMRGAGPLTVIALVVTAVGIITTFVSHTVAAMVLLPLIGTLHITSQAATGKHHQPVDGGMADITAMLGGPQMGTVLVMLAVLMCSGAMAFPISSFPNVNSLLAEDEQGQPWLAANDFILPGGIISAAAGLLLIVGEAAWATLFF
jgi:phosphate transporter